jgi:hypothetical protein
MEGSDCSSMEPKFVWKIARYFYRGLEFVSEYMYNQIQYYFLSAAQLDSVCRLVGL